jgi:hypothetical protein
MIGTMAIGVFGGLIGLLAHRSGISPWFYLPACLALGIAFASVQP